MMSSATAGKTSAFGRWTALFVAALLWVPGFTSAGMASGLEIQFDRVGPFGGSVRSLLIHSRDSSIVYLGTGDGQIYRSGNGGANWELIAPGIGRRNHVIDALVQHPDNPDHLFAGAWDLRSEGGGLFESRDGGHIWAEVKLPLPAAVRDIAVGRDNHARMVIGTLSGAFVSEDGGVSWEAAARVSGEHNKVKSVAMDPRNSRRLLIGTWRLGYRSADFGRRWERADKGMLFDSDVFSLAVSPRAPDVVYAGACSGVYRSGDGGASWQRMKLLPAGQEVRAQVVFHDPAKAGRVYAGTTAGLFVTLNDGATWQRITSPKLAIHAIQVDSSNPGRMLLGTEQRGILRSEDGGKSWRESNRGFVHRRVSRIFPILNASDRSLSGLLSDGTAGGFYRFDAALHHWNPASSESMPAAPVLSLLVLPDQGGRLAGTPQGIYWQRSTTARWTRLTGASAKLAVHDLAWDAQNSWIFAGTNEGIYRARAAALDFHKPSGYRTIPRVTSLVVSSGRPVSVYAASNHGLLRSQDQGVSWEIVSTGLPVNIQIDCLAVSPASPDHILAGTPSGLFMSRDGGNSWSRTGDERLHSDIPAVIFLDEGGRKIMVADNTAGGLYITDDGGAFWHRVESPGFSSPVRFMVKDPLNPSAVYLGTNSEGVYRLRLGAGSPASNQP